MDARRTKEHLQHTGGFTLIELLVAFAIFAVVATSATGALLTLVDANRKAQATNVAMTNLNFALESMARGIRTGYNYRCNATAPANPNCSNGTSVYFESDRGDPADVSDDVVYRFNETQRRLERSTNNGADFLSITAEQIDITDARFIVRGAQRGSLDNEQPQIVLLVRGAVRVPGSPDEIAFSVQTLATQRAIDF